MQRTKIYTAPWREKWQHFACPFGALTSEILKIWKKLQIPEDVRILTLFSDLWNSISKCSELACKVIRPYVQHYTDPHSARPGKLIHFACYFGALKSGILRIRKKFQIPENLRSITFFSDPRYSPSKCSELACTVNRHFHLSITQILTAPGRQRFTLHASLEHLKVEYCRSEKSARFLTISGLWHFFQILEIPLISAPNRHAKWINLFCPGTCTQVLTAPDQKKSIHCACWFGALRSEIS
jgi:hypothetical protein